MMAPPFIITGKRPSLQGSSGDRRSVCQLRDNVRNLNSMASEQSRSEPMSRFSYTTTCTVCRVFDKQFESNGSLQTCALDTTKFSEQLTKPLRGHAQNRLTTVFRVKEKKQSTFERIESNFCPAGLHATHLCVCPGWVHPRTPLFHSKPAKRVESELTVTLPQHKRFCAASAHFVGRR